MAFDVREALVEAYPKLHRYALSKTRDADQAEDMVLEACKRILERDERMSDEINVVAYAITIIRNLMVDRSRLREDQLDEQAEGPIDHSRPGELFELGQLLSSLGEECEKILTIFAMGHSYADIAKTLEVAQGTVMSRMSRCRSRLQSVMAT
jgi:RNA polymerase sigma-70 factor (ECF subfamily)